MASLVRRKVSQDYTSDAWKSTESGQRFQNAERYMIDSKRDEDTHAQHFPDFQFDQRIAEASAQRRILSSSSSAFASFKSFVSKPSVNQL